MSSIIDGLLQAIIPSLNGLRVTEYTLVACATLLAYEYFLTLDREVFYVWGSSWSFGKIIFFWNRYSPVVDTVLAIYTLAGAKDPHICPPLATATAWAFVSGMFVTEIILAMRTYAIWGARRSILVFLVVFTLAVFASASVLTQRFLDSLIFIQIPPFIESLGVNLVCAPLPPRGQASFEFMVFMVNQAVIAALTLYRGLQQYRTTHNPMIKTMFQDGLLYYVYTLILSVANVAVAVNAPVEYGVLLELPLRVVSSICCTRVLLNIRGAYFNPHGTSHDGVLGQEKDSFRWGRSSGTSRTSTSMTLAPSDLSHPPETRNHGWVWNDGQGNDHLRLSLRSISPFQCELPDSV
ncbi:hypothetical protein JB92DRAFT_2910918 [Gautieria morchelliformis]|nr:hypothetical protein JB92DRAFT_2910918 [Gautieria morchelliformis]